ncbi:alpha-L-fucosidase [Tessaracoccus sp. MC1865]|uniref:alpha-L-fucosidase n=1 Tax=Tessaracoccus sp. MC1865 TaxID=2760310 RepID=UPI0015FEEF45|nr:alpha-L-fucosidase [Tessaracoccus sp. MC1865]MBB1482381.1 alpha-L-fucosidase [Tessaracoccus sp. MC1865]QTO38155.1 alpha-L-fucosidase [Tessaracoccus sp. MC1865]
MRITTSATTPAQAHYEAPRVPDRFERSAWFRDARFGMFIHWGVYSLIGEGEWVRSHQRLSMEDYEPWVERFNPQHVDFDEWASLAKAAGMEYAVFTAKHHDGYCMFDSVCSDYTSARRAPGRDFVAEFLAAFRRHGIKVGLYFTLIDWSHPDYPAYGDSFHPMRDEPRFEGAEHDFDRYLEHLHAQVEEICTRYGSLDILWFDFAYDDLRGEAWRGTELVQKVRQWQPDVLIDNRLEESAAGFGSIVTDRPSAYCGDFVSPEQLVPPRGIVGFDGAPVPWEACITLNNHWAWHHSDDQFKPAPTVVRKLVEVVSKGGNLLLNVGPDGDGLLPPQTGEILREVGAWVHANEPSIRGAGASALPKPEWGRWTQRGNLLYAHVMEQPIGPIPLSGLHAEDIAAIRLVVGGRELPLAQSWVIEAFQEPFVSLGEEPAFTYPLPDPVDTVLEIELR